MRLLLFLSSLVSLCFCQRTGKVFSLFNIVKFEQGPCTSTTAGLGGTCMTAAECQAAGGGAQGNCAAGFGTCCIVVTSACGGDITRNCTYIENPGFPATVTASQTCKWTIKKCQANICFHRLDFLTYQDSGPVLINQDNTVTPPRGGGDCSDDTLNFVTGSGSQAPQLCGTLTGMHIYLEPGLGGTDSCISQFFRNAGVARSYRIKVSQIPCGTSYTPPSGCDMWVTERGGTIKSYNFNGTPRGYHLNNQQYSTCIRQEMGFCSIQYFPTTGPNSFFINTIMGMPGAQTGDGSCLKDYVNIPGGHNGDNMCILGDINGVAMMTITTVNRFCGTFLNCIGASMTNSPIVTSSKPFVVMLFTNNKDIFQFNNGIMNMDFGYCLNYMQIPC